MLDYKESVLITMPVKDIVRAKNFYTDVLGLELGFDGGEEHGWTEIKTPLKGTSVGLTLMPDEVFAPLTTGGLVLTVKDLETSKKYLSDKGVKVQEIVDVPKMVSYFAFEDSEGNRGQMVADPRK